MISKFILSHVRMLHVFFVVGVDPFLFMISGLSCLLHEMVFSNWAKILLHFSIMQYLLPTNLLLLHCIELIFFFLLIPHHLSFTHLHLSLQINLIDLILIQPLEMIWLYTMWCKHAYFCLWVLSHEIMIICKLKLMVLLLGPCIALLLFALSFFLG